ncbi:hypothetical protein, partial [Lelliottia nimipressuralis]
FCSGSGQPGSADHAVPAALIFRRDSKASSDAFFLQSKEIAAFLPAVFRLTFPPVTHNNLFSFLSSERCDVQA